ncbi:GrpB family protein [Hyphomonas sp.]|uniref:GrpB family protein n=1 Tax=Hyphomonas sp. TaxID=87 RepID=UPI003918ED29
MSASLLIDIQYVGKMAPCSRKIDRVGPEKYKVSLRAAMGTTMHEPLVVPYDPGWPEAFAAEAVAIAQALPDIALSINHIGSTAIPGILAKPVIDMLGAADSLQRMDKAAPALEALGYEAMGAFGIPGRRYFRKTHPAGRRTHHLHVFETGSPHVERHIAFRDYLKAHPLIAGAYSDLKAQLALAPGADPAAYVAGKAPFVSATETAALAWYRRRGRNA